MANDTVQTETTPAIPPLALELEQLHLRVQRMERLLEGAETILTTIRYDQPDARRASRMIEFLGEQIEQWREQQSEMDCASDDLWGMMDKAQHGKLVRYGESVLEPVE